MTKKQLERLQREREGLAVQLARTEEQLRKLGPRERGLGREDPDVQRDELNVQAADLRRRLAEADDQLASPQLISRKKGSSHIELGSRVTVRFLTGSRGTLTANITENGNLSAGTISRHCELAKALLDHCAGEIVEFQTNHQIHQVQILAVR